MTHLLDGIATRYGRKQGFLRHGWFLLQYRLGLLGGLENLDWAAVRRLVFVCDGNICRSPYAEARARAAGLTATSFGLHATAGTAAHPTVQRLAGQAGLDLAGHTSRDGTTFRPAAGDLFLGFEPRHARALASVACAGKAQVTLLGLWGAPPRPHVEDPFGLTEDYFRTCLGLIDDAVLNIARHCGLPPAPSGDPDQGRRLAV